MKSTNLPRSGTTKLVGGIISASSRKNTVNDSRIDMAKLTYTHHQGKKKARTCAKDETLCNLLTFSPESDGK